MSGDSDTRHEGGDGIPSLRPWALSIDEVDYDFDRAATQKMPTRRRARYPLVRIAAWSTLGGATLAAAFLAAFGSRLASTRLATRATPPVSQPEPPRAATSESAPAAAAQEEPELEERSTLERQAACEARVESLGPQRSALCGWLVAHAEGRPAGRAPVAAVRALLAREGARKIAGRVVRDALDPGVVQITSSGAWGYCLRGAAPAPGPDGVFWMWIRRTDEHASVELTPGNLQACVLLEGAPAAEASDLAAMREGPAAADTAARVLGAIESSAIR